MTNAFNINAISIYKKEHYVYFHGIYDIIQGPFKVQIKITTFYVERYLVLQIQHKRVL